MNVRTASPLFLLLLIGAPASLAGDGPQGVVAAYIADELPLMPDDAAWDQVKKHSAVLTPQLITTPRGGGSVKTVDVQAAHDGQRLVIRLGWDDASSDQDVGPDTFRDAVAIGFPVSEFETPPSPFMGDAEHPVNIWQWTADFDAKAQGTGGFGDKYPHTEGVWYFPGDPEVTRQVTGWRGFEAVMELEARGFGTLERKGEQSVSGIGYHADGRWNVVLRRELNTGNARDPYFRAGDETIAIFAVWNGGEGDVSGMKAVTMAWTPFALAPTTGGK